MSRLNKVNPDHYKLAGRLSPDDLARELSKQGARGSVSAERGSKKAVPPWMANNRSEPASQPQKAAVRKTKGPAKATSAAGTTSTVKAPRARGSAARKSSPRAERTRKRSTAPRGTQTTAPNAASRKRQKPSPAARTRR